MSGMIRRVSAMTAAEGYEIGQVTDLVVHVTQLSPLVTVTELEFVGMITHPDVGPLEFSARIPVADGWTLVRLPDDSDHGADTERADGDNEGDQGGA